MKNKIYRFLGLFLGFLFFISCSNAGEDSSYTFSTVSAWPLLILGLLCAIATVPHDESSDKVGMRVVAALLGRLSQFGGIVLCIAGFWRWDCHWFTTLCILIGFGILANATTNASNKGLGAIVQLICAIAAVAACVFSYIQLW
jgi:hypothetical protein